MFQKSTVLGWVLTTSIFVASGSFASTQCGKVKSTNSPGFKTYTQGGWGACPSGNNPAMYLKNNFAAAFPAGLEIGCTNKYKFTTALAIQNFLPSGSTPKALPSGAKTNPTGNSNANVFAGQLVALTLNVRFDEYYSNFGSASGKLKDLIINSGSFKNMTVGSFLAEANKKIGSCSSLNKSFSDYNNTASQINEAYDNGVASGSLLTCPTPPPVCNLTATLANGITNVICAGASNGAINLSIAGGTSPFSYTWSNGANTQDLIGVGPGNYSVVVKDKNGCTATASASIVEPSALELSGSVTQSTTCVCNGSANITISGGTEPYTINWSNGSTNTTSLSDLCPVSNLSVTVTDKNGCSKSMNLDPIQYSQGCNAVEVVSSWQGPRWDNTPVDGNRSQVSAMKGTPEKTDILGTFYALGFGGWAILRVNGSIIDNPGPDLRVVETTWHTWDCARYSEKARIEVSQDMVTWHDKGVVCQDALIDISPLPCIAYVRITDVSVQDDFNTEIPLADGYDVDGIECIQPATNGRKAVKTAPSSNPEISEMKGNVAKNMSIYPNPSEGNLAISLNGTIKGQNLNISVMDQIGRQVKFFSSTATGTSQNIHMNLDNLDSGLYLIRVKGEGINLTQKMFKK